jgi:hypothetical protein
MFEFTAAAVLAAFEARGGIFEEIGRASCRERV